jgi:prepilin-type processing-associated H-X9-DG protein
MRSRTIMAGLTLTLLIARHALAADAKALGRFVDAQTFAVLVLELDKLDAPALLAWHAEYFKAIEPDARQRDAVTQEFTRRVNEQAENVKTLRAAGAAAVYLTARDRGKGDIPTVAVIVPVAPGKDTAAVQRLLRDYSGPPDQITIGTIDSAVVAAPRSHFDALATARPAAGPIAEHLTAALAPQPGAAARLILLPAGHQLFQADPKSWVGQARSAIEQMDWAVLTLEWPPRPAATATINTRDDAAARSVSDTLSKLLAALKASKEVRDDLPGGPRLLDMLAPQVQGRQVIAGLSSAEVETLVRDEVPAAYAKAKDQAKRIASMSNVRQLLMAILMYSNDHRGHLPPNLAALTKYINNEEVFRNPRQPERKQGYTYVKPAEARITQIKRPSERIVVYEALDEWKGGVTVGFLDGHVEWITEEAEFDELLKAVPKPPEVQPSEKPVVLFNGKDLAAWKLRDPRQKQIWTVVSTVKLDKADTKKLSGAGPGGTPDSAFVRAPLPKGEEGPDLVSDQQFGDCLIELEFMVPKDGNSGLFIQGQYEVQITDSFGVPADKLGNGDCGGVPWVKAPSANACKPPGQWQTLAVTFRAPRFGADGKKTHNARLVSVVLNGKQVQQDLELTEPTGLELDGGERAKGPLMLQGLEGIAAFRNIRVTAM